MLAALVSAKLKVHDSTIIKKLHKNDIPVGGPREKPMKKTNFTFTKNPL